VKQFLRGNYTLKVVIEEPAKSEADSTDEFEKKALSRLGGSICFVSKKAFVWTGEGGDGAGKADRRPA